jgi:uroporphyrinogen decarboxylase
MTMTSKDRVIAQIQHRETDFVPYTLSWEGDVPERLDAWYGSADWRSQVDNDIRWLASPDLVVNEFERPTTTDHFGSVWRTDRRPFHLEKPALSEPTLKDYAFPALEEIFYPGWKEEVTRAATEHNDHFVVATFGFGLFERTWCLRGFNEALMDAAGDPDFYDELVERISEHQMAIIERLLEIPIDGVMFSDDWGYQQGILLGPERWRRFIKPRLAQQYARVHAAGKFVLSHCCGSAVAVIPDLIEIGLDVLESVQPEAAGMNPYELKRRFGRDIAFWGGLGSQSTIPFGAPGEIRAEVARLCREMGRGGGYILSPAKALQPETPTANAAAVVEAFLAQSGVEIGVKVA